MWPVAEDELSRGSRSAAEEARVLSEGLLTETREELVRADAKASMLLAALGVVVGVLLAGVIAGKWSPSELAGGAEMAWWVGAAAAAVGLGGLAHAVYPELAKGKSGA